MSTGPLEPDALGAPPSRWRRISAWLLNAWLVYHCAALFLAPASVPPTSPLFGQLWSGFGTYLQCLYLNHGYHFFAPEPSSSTLLGYRLEFADGRVERGELPNRKTEPRLLYHRYFMLTEQMAAFDRMEPKVRATWIETYAQALGRETGAARVTLTRIRHDLARKERIRAGGSLGDPDLYAEELLGTFECRP